MPNCASTRKAFFRNENEIYLAHILRVRSLHYSSIEHENTSPNWLNNKNNTLCLMNSMHIESLKEQSISPLILNQWHCFASTLTTQHKLNNKNSIQSKFYWFEWLFDKNWGIFYFFENLIQKGISISFFLNIIHIVCVCNYCSSVDWLWAHCYLVRIV